MALTQNQVRELKRSELGDTGNRVALAIALRGLTKVDIANEMGVPYTYLSDVAAGRFQTITVENAHKFAAYFGVSIEDLFPARQALAS